MNTFTLDPETVPGNVRHLDSSALEKRPEAAEPSGLLRRQKS